MYKRTWQQTAAIIAVCFFLSGFAGLVYQVLWVRILSLIFGATHLAVSTVLTAFMGGLALGSYLGGRWADRIRRPLVFYGVLQAIIGLYGFFVPAIFRSLTPLYQAVWTGFHPSFAVFSLIRFAAAAAVLIIPATAMGATLPVLSRFFARQREEVGFDVGRIYGLNTLGAVFGALAPVFVLIPVLGVNWSIVATAILSLLIAAVSVVVGWPEAGQAMPAAEAAPEQAGPRPRRDPRIVVALIAFAVSGFVGMTYEIAYTRYIANVVPSTTYAFTIMLATFLVALALGSLGGSYLSKRSTNELFLIGLVQLFVGVSVYLSTMLFREVPYWFFALHRSSFGLRQASTVPLFVSSASVVFLPALFMGTMFPLVVKYCTRDLRFVGSSVGVAAAVNTIGSILGSFAGGFILLPLLGLMNTFALGMCANLVLALVLVTFSQARGALRAVAALAALLALINIFAFKPTLQFGMSLGGRYFISQVNRDVGRKQFMRFLWGGEVDVMAHADGVEAAVSVVEDHRDGVRALLSNGRGEGSTGGDMPTQVLAGCLPLAIAPSNQEVLVIGFATGTTVGSALNFPEARVTCAEIEPAMIEFSRFFEPVNGSPLQHRGGRLKIELNDARNLLLVDPARYDVIISEPSNIYVPGITNLFSTDFYALAKSRLKEKGIFAQWVQAYTVTPDVVRTVARTFSRSFTHIYVFQIGPADLCLVGTQEPLRINADELSRRLSFQPIREDLERVKVRSAAELMATYLFGRQQVEEFVSAGTQTMNTDDNLFLELEAPKDYWLLNQADENVTVLLGMSEGEYPDLVYPGGDAQRAEWLLDFAEWRYERGHYDLAERIAAKALPLGFPIRARALIAKARLAQGNAKGAVEEWDAILRENPRDVPTLLSYAAYAAGRGDTALAASYAKQVIEEQAENPLANFYVGLDLSRSAGKAEAAQGFEIAARSQELRASHPEVLYNLAFCEMDPAVNRLEAAAEHLSAYVKHFPDDATALYYLGAMTYYQGKADEAITIWQKASFLADLQAKAARDQAALLAARGDLVGAASALRVSFSSFRVALPVHIELGQLLWRLARYDELIEVSQATAKVFPKEGFPRFQLALAYQAKSQPDLALQNYDKALQLEADPAGRVRIEEAIQNLKRQFPAVADSAPSQQETPPPSSPAPTPTRPESAEFKQALESAGFAKAEGRKDALAVHARQLLQLDPQSPWAHYYMALVLLDQGNQQEAVPHLEVAVTSEELIAKEPGVLVALATCYLDPKLQQYQKAIPVLEKRISISPNARLAHYHLGAALQLTGDREGALVHWETAYLLSVDESQNLLRQGRIAFAAGNLVDATAFIQASADVFRYNADALIEVAGLRYGSKDIAGAIEALNRVTEIAPGDKRIYYNLAQMYEDTGDVERAILNYKRYVVLEPDPAACIDANRKITQLRESLPPQPPQMSDLWKGIEGAPSAVRTAFSAW